MIEYIVLFATHEHAERAGLPGYTTQVGNFQVVRLRIPFLPWSLIRECVAHAKLTYNSCSLTVASDQFPREYLLSVVEDVVSRNLIPVQINQW